MEKLGPGDPQHIGKYRLLARLGAGGMGHVYLARSERGRTVAVKLVRTELAAQEDFRARFRQEVRNAQRVGGFWTAPVLDADTEAAVPWVATGYVAGPSLQRVVEHDHGPLPERSVRIMAAGLAHALTNIHAAGIVHRDLKPSNVMLTIEGPRVIDFGIARALETLPGEGITQTGSLVGSPGFMAPEQVRGDRITPASDVFSLGSVLAYAATGRLPFGSTEGGAHAQLFRIAQEEPDLSGIPEGIADVVRDCLRKDPATRPSLDAILARTGAVDTVEEGRSRDPWLPGSLVAQLGRHAVELLEVEDPTVYGTVAEVPRSGSADQWARGSAEAAAAAAGARPAPGHPQPAFDPPSPEHAPAHPAYGYPNQPHQHPQPYNPYTTPHTTVATPEPTQPLYTPPPLPPYDPTPDGESRRTPRSTALLVTVALVVLLAAGGSVYALMNNGDDDKAGGTATPTPSATAPTSSGEPTPSGSPSSSAPAADTVPTAFLGTWTTVIDNSTGHNTRELTIRQGAVGDTVLTLVADGPGYHCEFDAKLAAQPGSDGPLEIGPSTVTTGKPRSSCSAGKATEVTLLSDGRLKRVQKDGEESLTYSKQ